jgi:hypothetical protein
MARTWHPEELVFTTDDAPAAADGYGCDALRVRFRHETGETHAVPGFRDGPDTWRVRFAPPKPGRWTWAASGAAPGLEGSGRFEADPAEGPPLHEHGFLRAGERALRHADGTPHFWLADTVWGAGSRATPEEWATYLDRREAQGFSAVQVNALPQHDATEPDDRLPFGEEWDLTGPDPEYFRALDGLVAAAHERGLVPALVALWFNYVPTANADWGVSDEKRHHFDAEKARRFGRYLGARYGAYGAAWLVSGDSEFPEGALPVYRACAEGLRDACTHPLLTAHQPGGQVTPPNLNDEDWLDFHMYQSSHVHDLERPAGQARACRLLAPSRPVLNGEPAYEGIHDYDTGEPFDRETVRAAGWLSVLAGGSAGLTYGAHGLWPWHRESGEFAAADRWGEPPAWDEALERPAAADYARLRSVLVDHGPAALSPRADLLTDPADPRAEALAAAVTPVSVLVYTARNRALTLADLPPVVGTDFEWLDPATGETETADASAVDGGRRVEAPVFDGDALLVGER